MPTLRFFRSERVGKKRIHATHDLEVTGPVEINGNRLLSNGETVGSYDRTVGCWRAKGSAQNFDGFGVL